MSTAVCESESLVLTDPILTKAILASVSGALDMCGLSAKCVGISSVPSRDQGRITGMIGVHGKVSGFVTVNMSERLAIAAVEGLLDEKFGELTSQVVDGAGEITNMVVGGIKANISSSPWSFGQITVPSVIVGEGYQIAYAKGLEFVGVVFEHNDPEAIMLSDRLLQVNISLLRL